MDDWSDITERLGGTQVSEKNNHVCGLAIPTLIGDVTLILASDLSQ